MKKQLLKASTVAAWLDVPVSTVYFWAQTGRLKPIRIGRIIRFDPDEIERLLEKDKERLNNQ